MASVCSGSDLNEPPDNACRQRSWPASGGTAAPLAARAAEEGKSLNDLVVEAISERVRGRDRGGIAA